MIYIVLFFCGILVGCDNSVVSDCKDYNIYLRIEQADGVSTSTPLLLNNGVKVGKVVRIEIMPNGDILFTVRMDCKEKLPVNTNVSLNWSNQLKIDKAFMIDYPKNNKQYYNENDTLRVNNMTE